MKWLSVYKPWHDRIRQLSAQKGHTLGISHNFAASVADRASVMDYPHPLLSFNEQGKLDVSRLCCWYGRLGYSSD